MVIPGWLIILGIILINSVSFFLFRLFIKEINREPIKMDKIAFFYGKEINRRGIEIDKIAFFYGMIVDTRDKLVNLPEDDLSLGLCYYFSEYMRRKSDSVIYGVERLMAEFKSLYFNPAIIRKSVPLDPGGYVTTKVGITPDFIPLDTLPWNDPELDEGLLIKELRNTYYWWHPNDKRVRIRVCDIIAKQLYELMLENHG